MHRTSYEIVTDLLSLVQPVLLQANNARRQADVVGSVDLRAPEEDLVEDFPLETQKRLLAFAHVPCPAAPHITQNSVRRWLLVPVTRCNQEHK